MEPDEPMSPRAKAGVGVVVAAALLWFLVSWRVLDSPLIDAVGETLGALAVLLIVVSLAGALRR